MSLDWETRDVLIGLLRGQAQLECNLTGRFYHTPAKLLPCAPEQIKTIALYQSRRQFGDAAGIRYIGRVSGFCCLRRGEITELPTRTPDEPFVRFDIARWRIREPCIQSCGTSPAMGTLTSQALLCHSRTVPELYLRTKEDWLIYDRLRQASHRTLYGGEEAVTVWDGAEVVVGGWVITAGARRWDLHDFARQPYTFLQMLRKYMSR